MGILCVKDFLSPSLSLSALQAFWLGCTSFAASALHMAFFSPLRCVTIPKPLSSLVSYGSPFQLAHNYAQLSFFCFFFSQKRVNKKGRPGGGKECH